jgi:demethylmenaquinone methyltransferase/2-methoxy-6-polyprenyl-1,4-benzoquinol methylase
MKTTESPSKDPGKISSMFTNIAPRYDLLNRVLSLGIDRRWRKFAVQRLPKTENAHYLDVATGTCDVAIDIVNRIPGSRVTGVDFSDGMLRFGREKVFEAGLGSIISLQRGDATALPFADGTFDGSIIAFGIRNVNDYKKGVSEMARVVKKGGRVVVLEFTSIQNPLFRAPYRFYITKILPFIGELVSGKKGAYEYLPSSMIDFPGPDEFARIMESAGLANVKYYSLSFGITAVHTGEVPNE